MNLFISHCKTTQAIWNALRVLYEGTKDVKKSKINTLTKEFELFHVEPGEIVASMQMRFSHIINKLENLGKTTYNQDYDNKILRSMCKEWQPKVTAIKESHDLKTLDMSTLFGKLTEREHELNRLKASESDTKHKDKNKEDKKNISLKAFTSKVKLEVDDEHSSGSSLYKDMRLFVMRYNKYTRRNGLKHSYKNLMKFRKSNHSKKWDDKKKEEKQVTCFKCGKIDLQKCGKTGHYKNDCASLAKYKGKKTLPQVQKPIQGQHAYVAW